MHPFINHLIQAKKKLSGNTKLWKWDQIKEIFSDMVGKLKRKWDIDLPCRVVSPDVLDFLIFLILTCMNSSPRYGQRVWFRWDFSFKHFIKNMLCKTCFPFFYMFSAHVLDPSLSSNIHFSKHMLLNVFNLIPNCETSNLNSC